MQYLTRTIFTLGANDVERVQVEMKRESFRRTEQIHTVRCIQPIIFFSHTKPALASSHQSANNTILLQQISTSHQPQHSKQNAGVFIPFHRNEDVKALSPDSRRQVFPGAAWVVTPSGLLQAAHPFIILCFESKLI